MDLGIQNKVALVAASSKGLGKAVAIELAKEGAHVIINGRNEISLQATAKEIENLSQHSVLPIQGDLTDSRQRNELIQQALNRYGNIDILVTNGGGPPTGKFEDFTQEDWDQAYKQLLASTVGLIRNSLPGMKKTQWGRIITITSQAIKQPVDNLILSNSVRASIAGLVKTLSNEVGSYNITVNNVMPGYTKTERLTKLSEANPLFAKAAETVPLGRFAEPEEFAAAVAFLASTRASYITGISLAVDGGWIKNVL